MTARRSCQLAVPLRWRSARGRARGRGGNYSKRELETWAQRLHGWRAGGEVYAYFNNDWLSSKSGKPLAVDNAMLLKKLLDQLAASEMAL